MANRTIVQQAPRWAASAFGVAALGYAALAGLAWWRYGKAASAPPGEADPVLDRFIPAYDVVERHRVRVDAPAEVTLAAAREMDLQQSWLASAIFSTREALMRGRSREQQLPRGLEAQMRALGWGVLAEVPGRELVMGAVTRPWEANPIFRAVPAEQFAAFDEPDYVRIAWTLRVDVDGEDRSVFRTETRAAATDAAARAKFRRYWSLVSPGIWTIRRLMLRPVKTDAERRWKAARAALQGVG